MSQHYCRDCKQFREIIPATAGCCQECCDYRQELVRRMHSGEELKGLQDELLAKKRAAGSHYERV